ncbi:PrpR N-terminal domain-containing protein [Collinsella sp. zg1085]|uniref:sigma-54-dependent Fis family transcriptional regulator n=1 Tax=Collinsella sp. zg1085 TaxID=2844380 RepID=UPI001C0C7CFC|nr:sigma-54-dependent Fis family transcriptional regulator [Collinsella sp. zg1085]QWT17479.1 PrpR N-terminal domain-containing protein [Collinsella sp. zg1085]
MQVLALAPYPALLPIIEEVAHDYPDLEVTPASGNLDEAFISALSVFHKDFDAVISRGGTAESLEEEFSLPIIAIKVSPFDIVRCVQQTGAQTGHIAAVGFRSILADIPQTAELLGFHIDCFPIDFEDELDEVLNHIEHIGYDAVIGDAIASSQAQKRGLNAALIASGHESVREAFERAQLVLSNARKINAREQLLRDIVRLQGIRLAVFSGDGELSYTTLASDEHGLLDELTRHARKGLPPKRFLFRRDGALYSVRSLVHEREGKRQLAFTISSELIPGKNRQTGISYLTQLDIEASYHTSTFAILEADAELKTALQRMGSSSRPVFIAGETGSGKPRVVQLLYLLSPYTSQPYIEINCDIIDDAAWDFLISDHRSPLFEAGFFIAFRSLHMLSALRWRSLLGVIQRTRLADRSKLVFSYNLLKTGEEPEVARHFADVLDGFRINVPPLRRIKISAYACERYLKALAQRDGQDAPVLSDEAIEIINSYHWPRNILQFKQVMNWAYATAQEHVITAATLRDALHHESTVRFSSVSTPDAASMIDVLKPLSETTAEIARMVVESYGGNRSVAAKTLGISRTTLWSMLKRSDERTHR